LSEVTLFSQVDMLRLWCESIDTGGHAAPDTDSLAVAKLSWFRN
jgi:hypothetical protein